MPDTDQPTLAVTQADREAARQFIADEWPSWDADHQTVSAALMVAFARHRTNFERPAGDLREAAQRVVDDYPAAAGACASIEGGDGKPGWGSIRRLAEALAAHSPAPMALQIGDRVRVSDSAEFAADWQRTDLWVSGLAVDERGRGINVTVSEQWPIPSRHTRGYMGQTDGFIVDRTDGRPDDLILASSTQGV